MSAQTTELRFRVGGMRCATATTDDVVRVSGDDDVAVDIATKLVRVRGTQLDDAALLAAINDAGYEAETA